MPPSTTYTVVATEEEIGGQGQTWEEESGRFKRITPLVLSARKRTSQLLTRAGVLARDMKIKDRAKQGSEFLIRLCRDKIAPRARTVGAAVWGALPKPAKDFLLEHEIKLKGAAILGGGVLVFYLFFTVFTALFAGESEAERIIKAGLHRQDHGAALMNKETAYSFLHRDDPHHGFGRQHNFQESSDWAGKFPLPSAHTRHHIPSAVRRRVGPRAGAKAGPAAPAKKALPAGANGKPAPHHVARTDQLLSHIAARPLDQGGVMPAGMTARGRRTAINAAKRGTGPSFGGHGLDKMVGSKRRSDGQYRRGPHDAQFLATGVRPGAHIGEGKIVTSAFHFHPTAGHEVARTHVGADKHVHREQEKHVYHALHLAAGKNKLLRRHEDGTYGEPELPKMSWEMPQKPALRKKMMRMGQDPNQDPYGAAYMENNVANPLEGVKTRRASRDAMLPRGELNKGGKGGYRGGGYGSYGLAKKKEKPEGPQMVPYTVGRMDHSWNNPDKAHPSGKGHVVIVTGDEAASSNPSMNKGGALRGGGCARKPRAKPVKGVGDGGGWRSRDLRHIHAVPTAPPHPPPQPHPRRPCSQP